ncbi:hypothetical protein SCFA_180024 [anaerobic digester metagenome]|uniref:Uncharacterized protein n=1 Tax=anaerobic digester metagenome TaxID=1263854 RepID=A0A485LX34_9ZZZZ
MPPAKLINAVIEKINNSIGTPFFSCYVSDNRVTVEKFYFYDGQPVILIMRGFIAKTLFLNIAGRSLRHL